MAETINLRRVRKQLERTQKESVAAANRLAFGVSKQQRRRDEAEEALARRKIDGHKRDE